MTSSLLAGLRGCPRLAVRHINTQVSRSLAEKGGQHSQLRKSLAGFGQALRVVAALFAFHPHIVYLPLTNSPSFRGFLRDALFIAPALLLRRKVAIRLHGGYYYYAHTRGWQRAFVRALLGRVSLAMVQGQRLRTAFNDIIPAQRIAVVPNGIDDNPFAVARQGLADRPAPTGPRRVLFVGILHQDKGVRDVIAAVPNVPQAQFIFAGEWPSADDEREVRAFLESHGVADRVTFAGVVSGSQKYDLFLSADIFVFPTYYVYEGHAVSSVEALAAGLPIVCTNHGALDESVRDGWNGFFVPRSDPQAIAARLNAILEDDACRRELGRRSRQLYEERFTLAHFISAWQAAITALAGHKAAP